jgi:RNA polymerase sigma factor (TIGR02999 family)
MTQPQPPTSTDLRLTQLLQQAASGERGAFDRVFERLYPDLRRIAHARLRTHSGMGQLDTTALVHESFVRLVETAQLALADRRHFFTYAAKTMRNIIIDFARAQLAERRGGGQADVPFDTIMANALPGEGGENTLVLINDALLALEAVDPALAQVVEMRYFAGYGEGEIAAIMGTSERTVRRQWEKARAFLLVTLQP